VLASLHDDRVGANAVLRSDRAVVCDRESIDRRRDLDDVLARFGLALGNGCDEAYEARFVRAGVITKTWKPSPAVGSA
jgi:hypothetical protein